MMFSFVQTIGALVFTEKEGKKIPVGNICDGIIDPEKGTIVAFWVKTKEGLRILPKDAIQKLENKKMIKIDSKNSLEVPEKAHNMKNFFKKEVPILGANVWNREKQIGQVYDFLFDQYSFSLVYIYVKKGYWWWSKKRKIHRPKIVKINKKGVFISENTAQKIGLEIEG